MSSGATGEVAPFSWRDHLAALDALRRRVAVQFSVDAGEGVSARRTLFALGKPDDSRAAVLEALDDFERAIIEHADRLVVEVRRLKCLAALDRILGA